VTLGEGEVDGELEYEDGCAAGRAGDTHDGPLFVWSSGSFRLGPGVLYWRILLPLLLTWRQVPFAC